MIGQKKVKNNLKNIFGIFLVGLNEFAGQDNSELWTEERERELCRLKEEEDRKAIAVPGMLGPYDSRLQDQEIYPDADTNM